jgi:hypothetical protein
LVLGSVAPPVMAQLPLDISLSTADRVRGVDATTAADQGGTGARGAASYDGTHG